MDELFFLKALTESTEEYIDYLSLKDEGLAKDEYIVSYDKVAKLLNVDKKLLFKYYVGPVYEEEVDYIINNKKIMLHKECFVMLLTEIFKHNPNILKYVVNRLS